MPRCPDCDEKVSAQDTECPSCGTALRAAKKKGSSSKTVTLVIAVAVAAGLFLLCCPIMIALLLPAVQSSREAARRAQSKNNYKQIGIALHNYHDVHNSFPIGGTFSEDGQGQHGWMTALLPYVEQQALYQQIDQGQPWNAPQNQAAFRLPVRVYVNPSVPEQVDGQGYALAHYAGNAQVFQKNASIRLRDFIDGPSQTVLAGDVAAGYQPWGSPENTRDLAAGFGKTPTQFGSVHHGMCHVLLADGAVRAISTEVDPAVLKALATPDGKEPVSEF